MARRKRIHGKRRKRSPFKMVSTAATLGMFSMFRNGAIGGGDKTKEASDKAKSAVSEREGEPITRSEARRMIDQGVNRKVPATTKENKLSEGGKASQEMQEKLKGRKGGAFSIDNARSSGSFGGAVAAASKFA